MKNSEKNLLISYFVRIVDIVNGASFRRQFAQFHGFAKSFSDSGSRFGADKSMSMIS